MCEEKIIAELVDNQICDFGGKLEFDRGGVCENSILAKNSVQQKTRFCDFGIKTWFYNFTEKFNFVILTETQFCGFGGIFIFADVTGKQYFAILVENSILWFWQENTILRFCQEILILQY